MQIKGMVTNKLRTAIYISITPKTDQHLISPYNFTLKSHFKVTRKKEMITN